MMKGVIGGGLMYKALTNFSVVSLKLGLFTIWESNDITRSNKPAVQEAAVGVTIFLV